MTYLAELLIIQSITWNYLTLTYVYQSYRYFYKPDLALNNLK